MAEVALALLSPVISALIEKIFSVDVLDFFRRHDIDKGQLQKLKVTLRTVTKVVGDAERWNLGWNRKFLPCFNLCRKGMSVGEMEPRLKEIRETLEHLVKQMGPLALKEKNSTGEERSLKLDASSSTTSLVDASDIYGRDGDKERVVELLRSDDGIGMNVGVVLIVVMGGMGKTTLAQLVYKDDRVQQCFDLKPIWVYVPKELEAFQVTRDIMKEVGLGKDIDKMTANLMHCELERKLSGNKVLVVLDDVWSATQTGK